MKGLKFILLIGILAAAFVMVKFTPLNAYFTKEAIISLLEVLRGYWWGPAVFILIYGIGCVFALPGSVLTLAGGAIFGFAHGSIYNIIAANLGATLAFFMARLLGRDFVGHLMKKGKLAKLDEGIERNGFMTILRLRLIPIFPFNGLNFASGFSKMKYRDYFLGSLLGMIPATIIYTYFADALMSGVEGVNEKVTINIIIASVLLIGISFLPKLFRRKKNEH
jgi:uncharacterized membrane protein YdjX (TVP38/TMEM64 family)